jgi:hypothetical protein
MRNVCNPITAPFEDLDLVIEALLKTARLAVEKVIDDLVEPVVDRRQKGVKAFQPALFDAFDASGDGALGRLFALLSVKDRAQLFAQLVGIAQIRRAFQQQRARHIAHRTIDQLPQQRLIKGFGVRRARLVPIALLRRRRVIVASRTPVTLRAQLDEHSLFQNRQMPQADRIIVAVKLKGLLPAPRADRIGARTLNRDDDLSLFQFGLQNTDLGQVQRKLDHWRHRSIPLYRGISRHQPATTSTALQDHRILGLFRQFPESPISPAPISSPRCLKSHFHLTTAKDGLV